MKIGFSSLVCPTWDLETIITQASALGFDGFELRGLRGELNLPMVADLARHPDRVKAMCAEQNVELVSLGCSATLTAKRPREVGHHKNSITEFVELASRLGCPCVRMFLGDAPRGDQPQHCLPRIVGALQSLTGLLSRCGVTLLLENGGDFCGSADLWFVVDAVAHPRVQAAWNQCNALTVRERATTSLPRLGHKIRLVHACDALFDDDAVLQNYVALGSGHAEVSRQIEILKGMMYRGYVIFEWPKLWVESLPKADAVLPGVATFLRERVDAKQPVLTAYKGDKKAPRLTPISSPASMPGA